MREELILAARGETTVDLLLRNARLLNVLSGEVHRAAVAIHQGYVVGLGELPAREEVDLQDQIVAPGFIDAHVHLESSMVTVPQLARAVVPHGTVAVVTDPHEIANVLGVQGIQYILEASEGLPLRVHVMLPSCVPATHMETSGASLEAEDLLGLLDHPRVLGLAEVMNFPGVLHRSPQVLAKIEMAGTRPVDGHAPGLSGPDLAGYIIAGIGSDHECTTQEEALEKLRLGMQLLIREGSTAHNLETLLPLVTPQRAMRCSLCSDDRNPRDLLEKGHMDHLLRMAIRGGVDPILAVQMATISTARHYGLREQGAVAPGYLADLAVLESLDEVRVTRTYHQGHLVAEEGRYLADAPAGAPASVTGTVRLGSGELHFELPVPAGVSLPVRARVIELVPRQIVTRSRIERVPVSAGAVVADPERDLLKIAVVERHQGSGRVGVGLVRGFGLRGGAIASSVAHDSHNIVVVGASDTDMAAAVREVARLGGGQVVVAAGGEVRATLPLPVAGIISDAPLEEVRERLQALEREAQALGCTVEEPLMAMSFLALPVIPELKLTDLGLVDVEQFSHVPVVLEEAPA